MHDDNRSTTPVRFGIEIALLWRGDLLNARFFTDPEEITVGPNGTFVVPADVIGQPLLTLVRRGTHAGFGLCIPQRLREGYIIVDGVVHDLAAMKPDSPNVLRSAMVPLTTKTQAVVTFGAFTFIVSRGQILPTRPVSLWSRQMLPMTLSWLAAVLLVAGPLIAAFHVPADRLTVRTRPRDVLTPRTSQLLEIAPLEAFAPRRAAVRLTPPPFQAPPLAPKPSPPRHPEAEKLPKRERSNDDAKADALDERLNAAQSANERAKVVEKIVSKAATDALAAIFVADDGPDPNLPTLAPAGPTADGAPEVGLLPTAGGSALMAPQRPRGRLREDEARTNRDVGALRESMRPVRVRIKRRSQRVRVVGSSRGSRTRGALPANVIQAHIRRRMGAIRACYQKGLQENPRLTGKVHILFLIRPSGAVAGAKARNSSLAAPAVERCILASVTSWTFPRAMDGGSTHVNYPFRFIVR